MEKKDGWREVCGRLENQNWTQPDDGNIDQVMVDYTWCAVELKLCWTYQQAYRLALQQLAVWQDEICLIEVAKVEHLANNFNFRTGDGNGVDLKTRQFPKDCTKTSQKSQALLSRARRLRDLALQMSSGRHGRGIFRQLVNLRKKLGLDDSIEVHQVVDMAKQCEYQAKEWSRRETAYRLSQWKSKMRNDYGSRAKWLTRPA